MKLKIPLSTVLVGLLIVIVVTVFFKVKPSQSPKEPKQGISDTAVSVSNEQIQEIRVTAKKFSFSPNVIRLRLNEKVRLRVTSEDVTHGFSVPELGIDQVIEPGNETLIDVLPTKKGTFTFLCSFQCGTGHSGMRGSIVVE